MRYGFIKVAAATPAVSVADTRTNADEIIRICNIAAENGIRLIVFPELSVTGATCGDLFLGRTLAQGAEQAIFDIAAGTALLDMAIVIGAPIRRECKLYNCGVVLHMGEIVGVVPKRTVDNAVFAAAPEKCGTVQLGGVFYPFGADMLFYCDSLHEFNFALEFGTELGCPTPVSTNHARAGATVICSLAATSEIVGMASRRRILAESQSIRAVCGYVYSDAGCGESTTDHVFGGHRMIYENGRLLDESKPFENAFDEFPVTVSEIDVFKLTDERMKNKFFEPIEVTADNYYSLSFMMETCDTELTRKFDRMPFVPSDVNDCADRCEAILNMQSYGLRKRLAHTHAKCAVIGISGGLDSCLALLVAVRAMDLLGRPRTDVVAVTMPCFGTTVRTRTNAQILCERLGVSFRCVDIKAAVNQHFKDIGHDENEHNVVYENVQARERTQVIMDIANAEGGMVIGTGDLSELALGWATYNGDHMSMYGVNASVPKTLIRHIVRYCADSCGDAALSGVLLDILDTPVSPELLPADKNGDIAQKTEDLVGPYELHDFFMYWFMRYGFTPEKIEHIARYTFDGVFDDETIHKWLTTFMRRFFNQQFKRSCLPDGPKIGSVGVSPRSDLRMPSDAVSELWREW